MSLDLYPVATRRALADVATSPGLEPASSFTEGFERAWDESLRFANSNAADTLRREVISDRIGEIERLSDENVSVPMGLLFTPQMWNAVTEQVRRIQGARPDLKLPGLDEDSVHQEVVKRAAAARGDLAKYSERSQSLASSAGTFLGSVGGTLVDPVNAASLAIGAGAASGIVRTALIEAGVGAGSQLAIELDSGEFKREVDPTYTAGEALANVGMAAGGGAVLGGGIKALGKLWAHAAAGNWPRYVRDAGNVVSREAVSDEINPLAGSGVDGEGLGRANLDAAERAMRRNEPVQVGQEVERYYRPPSTVTTSDGRKVGVRYELMEADDLVTSHRDDLTINPDFPPNLQPRDRERAASQTQVFDIAANLDPDRLGPSPDPATGAPIIGPDDVVESGNGRVLGLRRAYRTNPAGSKAYRDFLRKMNLKPDEMRQPVLVGRRTTAMEPEARVAFANSANRATALRLSAGEQALADARLVDDRMLGLLAGDNALSASNRQFVRAFADRLPQAERGVLFDADGALSQEGSRRITAALMARAYGDAGLLGRVLEDTDSNVRALGGALGDAAGRWAAMKGAVARGDVPAGMDISDDLLAAFRIVANARDKGIKIADALDQADMFQAPSPTTRALLGFMFRDGDLARPASRASMREALESYAEEAMKNTADARLFGDALPSGDVLATALRKVGRDDLAPLAREAVTPEAMEKALTDPAVDDAVLADLDRLVAGPDAPPRTLVPLDNPDELGGDGVTLRSVDDVLAEADADIEAAAHLRACALPQEAA